MQCARESGLEPWTWLTCPFDKTVRHGDCIVISVDGACRDNGRPGAQGAAGVFFHQWNYNYNYSERILDHAITSQRAELQAAIVALGLVHKIKDALEPAAGQGLARERMRQNPHNIEIQAQSAGLDGLQSMALVVIKADSAYLVNSMTQHIYKWRRNGFKTAKGLPVVNSDLFRCLDVLCEQLVMRGVALTLWHVPRSLNTEADCLANAALDIRILGRLWISTTWTVMDGLMNTLD